MKSALFRLIISVQSADAALRFYRDILGLPAEPMGDMTRLGEGAVEILLHERPSRPSDQSVAPSFRVADVDTMCAAWEAVGGIVVDPPELQPWGERQAVVRDPDGHLVCLVNGQE